MGQLVIDFKNDGTVASLHSDAFDLGFLGAKKTNRQTDIVFDEYTQKWNLEYLIDCNQAQRYLSSTLNGFDTYEQARTAEVDWLNNCRILGIPPNSEQGMRIMAGIRKYA